jgi:hypothetical protein
MISEMQRSSPWVVSAAVSGVVLAPFLALAVPFQAGLVLQFAVIVALLAGVWLGVGVRPPFGDWPRLVRLGLGLYGGAALYGLAVGLLAANPLRHVLSQTAALLLLPAAAVAFAGGAREHPHALAWGFAAAVPLALVVHLLAIAFPALGWGDPIERFRFLLRNDAGMAGAAPLVAMTLGGYWLATRHRWAFAAWVGVVLLVAGIMSRGGWLATGVGVVGVAVFLARRPARFLGGVAAAAVLLVVVWWFAAGVVGQRGRVVRREGTVAATQADEEPRYRAVATGDESAWVQLAERMPVGGAGLELEVAYSGAGGGGAQVVLALDASPVPAEPALLALPPCGGRCTAIRLLPTPTSAALLDLALSVPEGGGSWAVYGWEVRQFPTLLDVYWRQLQLRARELAVGLVAPQRDRNLDYRARELEAVVARWHAAPLARRLLGHGLGATFPFPNSSWDEHGRRITVPEASYIHNFFVFLGFKLGVGGLAALAGLAVLLVWAWREGRRLDERMVPWPAAVLAVGLAVYLLWSVSSPEIYDFRVAPLWGMLLATAIATTPPPQP